MRAMGSLRLAVWMVLLVAVSAEAGRVVGTTRDVTVVTTPDGKDAIMVRLNGLTVSADMAIQKATLSVPVTSSVDQTVELQVQPIVTTWAEVEGAVEQGEVTPGGEYHEELYARARLRPGATRCEFDISVIFTEIGEGLVTDGLLVTVPQHRGNGLAREDSERLDFSNAVVTVQYKGKRGPGRGTP